MVPETWARPPRSWRDRLLRAVEPWNTAPELALRDLDRLDEFPRLLNYFLGLFQNAEATVGSIIDSYSVRRLGELIDSIDRNHYSHSRDSFMRRCLGDALDVNEIVARVREREAFSYLAETPVLENLTNDLPLQCVLRARRLFQI